MKNYYHVVITAVISASYIGPSLADSPLDTLSLQISQSSISIDSFGAKSVNDKAQSYKLYASSKINNNVFIEYGFMNLGKFEAKYNISGGGLQFIESHTVDFSKNLFSSIKVGTTISGIPSYTVNETPRDSVSLYPPKNEFYFSAKVGVLLWQANLDMEGKIYDSGSLYDSYGASSDDYGFSTFYGIGIERGFNNNLIFGLNWEFYNKVGKDAVLKNIDGSTQKYSGRNVESKKC